MKEQNTYMRIFTVVHQERIIVLIEPFSSYQAWTTQRNIKSLNWNFYIIYWNENKNSVSRFELGNINTLNIIQKKMLHKKIKMKIFMVQPSVDSSKVSPEMRVILGGTRDFCRDTFSVSVKLICS